MATEKRLIDANALDEKLDRLMTRYASQGRKEAAEDYNFVRTVLLAAPTVDAIPIPCKLGQMIYEVVHVKNGMVSHINPMKCVGIHVGDFPDHRGHKRKSYLVVTHPTSDLLGRVPLDKIGKTVFLTKEAAERAAYPCEYCSSGTYRSCEGCSLAGRKNGVPPKGD